MKGQPFSRSVAMLCAILISFGAYAQDATTSKIWKQINESEVAAGGERYTIPSVYKTFRMDKSEMQKLLSRAPMEPAQTAMLNNGLVFEMPMPDGSYERFQVFEYYVMHPDLAAKFPEIKTYTGRGIDDASAVIKLDLTQFGFHAMVISNKGNFFIDPYAKNNTTDYICYNKKDLQRTSTFICEAPDEVDNAVKSIGQVSANRSSGTNLRTYRLALAATGEYTAFFGGTVNGAMAGMTTTMNRVNGVYETEVSIRMVMVANDNLLVYTNSSTDPYTNGNGSTMLGQNVTNCNSVIGSANYDIGHVFSTGGGGIAGLGVVCGSSKANGVTGSTSPTGDGYDIDYVAHEMGHQFGGNHTFNSTLGSCSGNRASSAAFEPGSGITVMAYAGICSTDDLAAHSIAYFHAKSFDEIVAYSTTGNGNSCPVTTATGNTAPVVTSVGSTYSIPISTPFVLTGAATDANGDALTYSWEEFDLGTAGAWNVQSTTAPMFRPFPPTTSASRTFPQLSDIINNTTTVGELLPNQARTLKFILTARDNRSGGGGVMHPDTTLNISVVNNGGAFAVTAPNTAVTWAGGSTQTVTWNVNGTTNAPINTANVKISLSTDGGNTFPTVILASTANDGTESITVPNTATTTARIKVEAVGNIFFDMSNTNFTITASAGLTSITTSAVTPLSYCAGASINVPYTVNAAANSGNIFTAQLSNSAGSFSSPVSIGTLTSTTAGTISATIPAGTATGAAYRVRVVSSNPVVTGSDNGSNISISAQVGAATSPQTGSSGYCANLPITFTTSPIANATTYNWSVNAGGIINSGQGTTQVTIVFPPGQPTTSATVLVFGSNANCNGTTGSTTLTIFSSPNTPTANNVSGCSGTPITLSGTPAGGTFSVSNPYSGSSATYTYNVATVDGCNATSAPANITVNPKPTPSISGTTSFCSGSSTTLNAGAGYSSYLWSTGATTQSINVTTAGTFTVTVTNANGCTGSISATTTVNANPTPSITGNTSFCSGNSTTLDAGVGYNSYFWSTGATTQSINVTTTGTFTVTVTNGNGCTGSTSATTIVNSLPVVSFSGLAASYNVSSAAATLTGSPVGGTFSGPGISGSTFTPSAAGVGGPYSIVYSYTNANGCSNTSTQQTSVTNCAAPAQPGTITTVGGAVKVCPGDSKTYSIAAVSGATIYTWTAPTGGTVVSGQGTTSVIINYTSGFTASGTLSVTSGNGCGNSIARTLAITRNTPVTPGVIVGAASAVCAGTTQTYSITNVNGLTYNWIAPANATIASGQGTNSVTVNFLAAFTSGTLSVSANNGCGTSTARTLTIISNPAVPGKITGTAVQVCANTSGAYSVTNVSGVTYNWTAPANATIASGQGTNAVIVNFSGAFTSGTLSVAATNTCGSSALRSLAIYSVPSTPGTVTGQGYGNCSTTNTFNISPVTNATSYTWSSSVAGATITPTGTSASITFPAFSSGNVLVTANNTCGSSPVRTFAVKGVAATPGAITGNTTVTSCVNESYSITALPGATSYVWTAPTGSAIVSGQGTTNVTVDYGTTSGSITVKGVNACGNGTTKSAAITVSSCARLGNNGSNNTIGEAGNASITAYPNPFADKVSVEIPSAISQQVEIKVVDILGKVRYKQIVPTNTTVELDIKLPVGIYMITTVADGQIKVVRVVKNK